MTRIPDSDAQIVLGSKFEAHCYVFFALCDEDVIGL